MKLFLLIICLFCKPLNSVAKNNSIHFEFLGKSIWYYSVAFERSLSPKISAGISIGYKDSQNGKYFAEAGEGSYNELTLTSSGYFLYRFFNSKHNLINFTGVTLQHHHTFVKYNNHEHSYHFKPYMIPFLALGYEYQGDRVVFRLPLYIAYIGESDWFYPVWPWIGVSLGYRF